MVHMRAELGVIAASSGCRWQQQWHVQASTAERLHKQVHIGLLPVASMMLTTTSYTTATEK